MGVLVAVIAAVGAVAAAIASGIFEQGGGSEPPPSQSSSVTGDCNVVGSGNTVENCGSPKPQPGPEPQPPNILGEKIPLNCVPPGERFSASHALEITVRLWCAQRLQNLLRDRRLVQTKLKLGVENHTRKAVDISSNRWFLLLPGATPGRRWSGKPGSGWPGPRLIRFQGERVTAIPANPNDEGEVIERTPRFINYTFETHWHTGTVAPGGRFWPPIALNEPPSARDGVLVFYVPLGGSRRNRSPTVLGLALVQGSHVVAFCPRGRWRRQVSAETF